MTYLRLSNDPGLFYLIPFVHNICNSLMKLGNCHTTLADIDTGLTSCAFATLHCYCMRVKTRSRAMAASYSSIKLLGRGDFFQISLPNLVKYHSKNAEKLYGRAQKWWTQIFTPNVVVFVRNTGPCRCSRSTYVLSQTKGILLKWISVATLTLLCFHWRMILEHTNQVTFRLEHIFKRRYRSSVVLKCIFPLLVAFIWQKQARTCPE